MYEEKPTKIVKKGWHTSEFWVSSIGGLLLIISQSGVFEGNKVAETVIEGATDAATQSGGDWKNFAVAMVAVIISAYTISRGIAKK